MNGDDNELKTKLAEAELRAAKWRAEAELGNANLRRQVTEWRVTAESAAQANVSANQRAAVAEENYKRAAVACATSAEDMETLRSYRWLAASIVGERTGKTPVPLPAGAEGDRELLARVDELRNEDYAVKSAAEASARLWQHMAHDATKDLLPTKHRTEDELRAFVADRLRLCTAMEEVFEAAREATGKPFDELLGDLLQCATDGRSATAALLVTPA